MGGGGDGDLGRRAQVVEVGTGVVKAVNVVVDEGEEEDEMEDMEEEASEMEAGLFTSAALRCGLFSSPPLFPVLPARSASACLDLEEEEEEEEGDDEDEDDGLCCLAHRNLFCRRM